VTTDALRRVCDRLRQQGIEWVWRRVVAEAVAPSTGPGQRLHYLARWLLGESRRLRRRTEAADAAETLYAFFDTKVEPITFDALWFILGAEFERRRLGLKAVHFTIVPGPYQGVRREDPDYEEVIDAAARRWRLTYLVAPLFTLLSSATGHTMASSRRQAAEIRSRARHVYPPSYEPVLPIAHRSSEVMAAADRDPVPVFLQGDPSSRAYVARWLKPRACRRKLVTVTLRQYGYMPDRNSNLQAWADFARRLDPALYFPVLLLDTEALLDPLPPAITGLAVFAEAAWNVGLRMALYEASYLCLGVNNGPMALCWLSTSVRYLTFKMLTPSVPQSSEPFLRLRGFAPDGSLSFAGPFQRWVWEDDNLEVIEREFAAMANRIDRGDDAGLTNLSNSRRA
jgi:hypothetical protein